MYSYSMIRSTLGISRDIRIYISRDRKGLLKICKTKIIEARRRGDDKTAAKLSEVKQLIKTTLRMDHCSVCGIAIGKSRRTGMCMIHARNHRYNALRERQLSE